MGHRPIGILFSYLPFNGPIYQNATNSCPPSSIKLGLSAQPAKLGHRSVSSSAPYYTKTSRPANSRPSQNISHNDITALRCKRLAESLILRRFAYSARRKCTGKDCLRSSFFHSTVVPAAAVAFAAAITAWAIFGREAANLHKQPNTRQLNIDTIPPAMAPGQLGNLTAEQEDKLRQLWGAVFKACGVAGRNEAGPVAANNESPDMKLEAPSTIFIFGFPRSAFQQDSTPSDDDNTTNSAYSDKHGLTKQYEEILASQRPEDIRQTLWAMTKHDHPDALLPRFLRARNWDVEKALVMLISAMNWRHTKMKIDPDIMRNGEAGAVADEKSSDEKVKKLGVNFLKQSRMGKSFLHGTDKEGRPICVVRVRLHRASDQSAKSLERYTVFMIETARLALKPPVETTNIIFDMTGCSLANMDYHPVKFMIQCFEANYPESLGVVLVHNASWVFQGIWRSIRGWLDPAVAAKVHFTSYRAGLEEYINSNQLIKDLDGGEDWEYEFLEPNEGENELMKDTHTRDRLLRERDSLYAQYEVATRRWIGHSVAERVPDIKAEREEIALKLRESYWQLDPYVRARSLYDRQGVIQPGGDVNWYRYQTTEPRAPSGKSSSSTNATADEVEYCGWISLFLMWSIE